jgi:hypothetical protein
MIVEYKKIYADTSKNGRGSHPPFVIITKSIRAAGRSQPHLPNKIELKGGLDQLP